MPVGGMPALERMLADVATAVPHPSLGHGNDLISDTCGCACLQKGF